jgi:hypothetical protein
MPLTKSFKELVQDRAARDPEFAAALLREDPVPTGDGQSNKTTSDRMTPITALRPSPLPPT